MTIFVSLSSFAKFIPNDFAFLFENQKVAVDFSLPNDFSKRIEVIANYDKLVDVDKQSLTKLQNYLLKSGVRKESIPSVIGKIFESQECDKDCDKIEAVYDYDSKTVQVIVSSELMDGEYDSEPYTNLEPNKQALIVNNSLYSSVYDDRIDIAYNGIGVVGLGKGAIDFNFDLDPMTSDTVFTANGLSYSYQMKGHEVAFGYDSFGKSTDNATSVLDKASLNEQFFLSLSSSNNLLKTKKSSMKKIYFDMKNKGMVSVKRNDRIIKTNYYPSGQNYINYDELPKGNYDVKLIIRAEGYPEEEKEFHINNKEDQYSLSGYDYAVSINRTSDQENDSVYNYIYSSILYPFLPQLDLGASLKISGNENLMGLYASYQVLGFETSLFFENSADGLYYNAFANYEGLQLDYTNVDVNDDHSSLFGALYGYEGRTQYSIGYGTSIFGGSLNVYKNYWKKKEYYYTGDLESLNSSLSVSYSKNIYKNWIMNLSYVSNYSQQKQNFYEFDTDEDLWGISLSIPLGEDFTATTYLENSSIGGTRSINTIEKSDLYKGDNLNLNGAINSNLTKGNSNVSLSMNGSYDDRNINNDFYVNTDSNGNVVANSSLNSTIITMLDDGESYTDAEPGYAYLVVESNADTENNGLVDIKKDMRTTKTLSLNSNREVIPVDEFSTYQYDVDYGSSGYSNKGDSRKIDFTYPGTVTKITNNLRKVVSFITYFEDFNDESLNNIKCKGDGCVDISRVGDGIYSISVFENSNYKIVSNGEYCFVDKQEDNYFSGISKCFPTIYEDDSGLQMVSSGFGDKDEEIIYLGKAESVLGNKLDKLEVLGLEPIEYKLENGNLYIFAKIKNKASFNADNLAKTELFNEIERYVNSDGSIHQYSKVN
ncbi:TcfC E-set like domain-containing protein [Vibrio owensii]